MNLPVITGMPRPAEFSEERKTGRHARRPVVLTRCWCGWKTTTRDGSLYGKESALTLEKLSHRLDHMEGRIKEALAEFDGIGS